MPLQLLPTALNPVWRLALREKAMSKQGERQIRASPMPTYSHQRQPLEPTPYLPTQQAQLQQILSILMHKSS